MKKIIFLTIAMIAILSLVCFAAFADTTDTIEDTGDSVSTSVKATIDNITPVYAVTVNFGNMEFSYSPTWNPNAEDGPAYEGGSWDPAETNMILVTNNSNVSVDISFSYSSWDDSFDNVNATFNIGDYKEKKWTVNTAAAYTEKETVYKYDSNIEECSICAFLNLSGDINPNAITAANTKIGTVTVTAYAVK